MKYKHTQYVDFSNPNADKITSGVTNRPMENCKQTAVEWFNQQLVDRQNGNGDSRSWDEIFEQAKQMEKDQIIDAHLQGLYSEIKMRGEKQAQQYYNETYGQN
jgi:hypothetical protein